MLTTSINAGTYKGQVLSLPPSTLTRAVSAKVRAAIFNQLEVKEMVVLDLFAGGGTLGFEALSMGAKSVVFVDKASSAVEIIRQNARSLGVAKKTTVIKADAWEFNTSQKFDIVFLDPPYAAFDISLVKSVALLVQLGGILVISCSSKSNFDVPKQFDFLKQKIYGDTKITYLRKV